MIVCVVSGQGAGGSKARRLFCESSVSGSASASFTIDLIWVDSGTGTLTVGAAAPGVSNCHPRAGTQTGRCLQIRLTAAESFRWATTTLAWNAWTGIAASYIPNKSFAPGALGDALAAFPALSSYCAPADPGCVGSFGGGTPGSVAAGTYIVGSISFDLSGAFPAIPGTFVTYTVQNFFRDGFDGILNSNMTFVPVQLEDAKLILAPQQGTASLLGLGIAVFVLLARRRT